MMAGAGCAALALVAPAAFAKAAPAFELAFWQAVSASEDPVLYEAYLKQYPKGSFASVAAAKAANLRRAKAGGAEAPATPDAANALRDASAAQAAAEAAQAAAAAATPAAPITPDSPVVTALAAPPAPTAMPVLAFASTPGDAAQDQLGNTTAMPVASPRLIATLTADPAPPPAPPPPPTMAPVPPLTPTAPPAMLASLGAPPSALPAAEALEAAVAAQATPAPVRLARAEPPPPAQSPAPLSVPAPAYAPPPRPLYAAAGYTARPVARRNAATARFTRAVVSTAAVSVEMPDATRQISPLGIMLGQLVRSQETPGTQYGLGEAITFPTRPRLMAMPEVAVPESFCSSEQRGAFTEGIYQPALAIARHNSEVAGAYVRKLRTLYDNYQLNGDSDAQAAVAGEARDFARAATTAASIHEELSRQFEDIMTTPLRACGAVQ